MKLKDLGYFLLVVTLIATVLSEYLLFKLSRFEMMLFLGVMFSISVLVYSMGVKRDKKDNHSAQEVRETKEAFKLGIFPILPVEEDTNCAIPQCPNKAFRGIETENGIIPLCREHYKIHKQLGVIE